MARKLNFRTRVYQDDIELSNYTTLLTFIAGKVTDDIGLNVAQLVIPTGTPYTSYAPVMRADALFTYILDVSRDVEDGTTLKINGDNTEFQITPDCWIEEPLTALQIKNEAAEDRTILMFQAYPRALSFV